MYEIYIKELMKKVRNCNQGTVLQLESTILLSMDFSLDVANKSWYARRATFLSYKTQFL